MYKLVACDTDSIKFCKEDGSDISIDERNSILKKMNDAVHSLIRLEEDGYYDKFLVIKSKNYVTVKGDKIEYKGSSIRDQKKEPILRELLNELIDVFLNNQGNIDAIINIYTNYCIKSLNITDIKKWLTKKTVTKAVLEAKRTNELKILNALNGEQVQEGDKIWLYTALGDILKQEKDFNNDANTWHYVSRVYDTLEILGNLVDLSVIIKYHLKKNRPTLERLYNEQKEKSKRLA